jgi:hypothetical protein
MSPQASTSRAKPTRQNLNSCLNDVVGQIGNAVNTILVRNNEKHNQKTAGFKLTKILET